MLKRSKEVLDKVKPVEQPSNTPATGKESRRDKAQQPELGPEFAVLSVV